MDPSRTLSTDLEESMLRGVSLHHALGCLGSSFHGHEFDPRNYDKSEEVKQLDDFLSHDWASDAGEKFLALCLIYNSTAAAWTSVATAALLVSLQLLRALPRPTPAFKTGRTIDHYGFWCQVCCPLVYFAVLFFRHHLRVRGCSSRRKLFVDKFCINQGDDEEKTKGVRSLAGFLARTDRLVICWTPRYFSRLWCSYEVAAWLFLRKPLDSVLLMPLCLSKKLVCGALWSSLCMNLFGILVLFSPFAVAALVVGLTVLGLMPILAQCELWAVRSLRELSVQLEQFSIRKAQCFCCSNHHRHPVTGDAIVQCDRKLVCNTVSCWFQGPRPPSSAAPGGPDRGLERFEACIRDLFRDFALETAQPTRTPYAYTVRTISLPWLFRGFDTLVSLGEVPLNRSVRTFIKFLAVVFLICPSAIRMMSFLGQWWDRVVGSPKSRCMSLASTFGFALLLLTVVILLLGPLTVVQELESDWPFAGVVLVQALVTAACFRADAGRWIARLRGLRPMRRWSWSSAPGPPPQLARAEAWAERRDAEMDAV